MAAAHAVSFSAEPIEIVGAGPAGLACAIVLAKAGRRVVVREQSTCVGARFHGDFQGLENWSKPGDILEELRLHGIASDFTYHPVCGGTAFDAWEQAYKFRASQPLYYLVRRGREPGHLDHALLQQALRAGVEVRFGDRVQRGHEHGTLLSGGPTRTDVLALGYLFECDMPEGDWICFNHDLAPAGYAYLLVHGGRGTIATCMFADFKQASTCLDRTVAFFTRNAGLAMRNPRRFGGYGNFRLPRTATRDRALLLGEHAGFQDALAGFGIRYAIRSGILAARSVLDHTDYTRLWRSDFLAQLRTSLANRLLIDCGGDHAWRWILSHRLASRDVRDAMRRMYQPSLLSRLMYPFACLKYRGSLYRNGIA